ncbi:hypothetical protein [Nocardia sp. CA-290969]|uniref:hypothetical protein n=1 Tax=Nocardia sp. CA-290969 TaxID=3239986 RepID=UPI003D8D7CBF
MKGKYTLVAVITCISMLASGCSLVREALGTGPSEDTPCVGTEFDLWASREVLVPAEPFNAEADRAASASEPTTLDAITAVAGWQGSWDRMIDVPDHATIDMLNSWAGSSSICWDGLSTEVGWTEGTSEGVYLFMDGATPVQTVRYTGPERLFFINRKPPVVERHEVLTPNGLYLLPPE